MLDETYVPLERVGEQMDDDRDPVEPLPPVYPFRLQQLIYGFALYAEKEATTLAGGQQQRVAGMR